MKNNVKFLFSFTAILLLASSFVKPPVPTPGSTMNASHSYGGLYVVFAGKSGGEISKQEINNQTEIRVDGCYKDAQVSGFTLVVTKSGKSSTLTSTTKLLTNEMLNKLKALTKGDQFEFRNTKANLPNNRDVLDVRGSKFTVV